MRSNLKEILKAEANTDRLIESLVDSMIELKKDAPDLFMLLSMMGSVLTTDQIQGLVKASIKRNELSLLELICAFAKLGLTIVLLRTTKKEKEETAHEQGSA